MTVFVVRTYTVKPECQKAHLEWGKKLVAMLKKQPKQFSKVRSMRVYSNKYGGAVGGFTAMWKFDSLADAQDWEQGFVEVKAEADLRSEFLGLIVPGSYTQALWEPVRSLNKKKRAKPKK
jgi:hypothetical protein